MYTRERLLGLKSWAYDNFCKGRMMKAPAPDFNVTKIVRQEPQCFIGWAPARPDARFTETVAVAPGIIIMPGNSSVKFTEEKPVDHYAKVHRPPQLSQTLQITMLVSVYEPGVRLEGFDGKDYSLILEATQEGLFTLTDWMDEIKMKLITDKVIPGTDLILTDSEATYSLYTEQGYVSDKRPLFFGYINALFTCYAQTDVNDTLQKMLL